MAKATIEIAKVPVTTYVEKTQVTLTLSHAEAAVLYDICHMVGGSPQTTPRGYVDTIRYALSEAGMERLRLSAEQGSNSIHFNSIDDVYRLHDLEKQ